jgi:hypothetical protein
VRGSKLAIAVAFAVLLDPRMVNAQATPAHGQDNAVMLALIAIVTAQPVTAPAAPGFGVEAAMNPVRGGNNSGKALGCFCGQWVTFKSGYKDVSAETIAEWVYALHGFVTTKGARWDGSGANDLDRETVPYTTIKSDFAQGWWEAHNSEFKSLVGVAQDGWLYDAILDGANVWFRYIMLYKGTGSDGVAVADAILSTYANAPVKEVFGP